MEEPRHSLSDWPAARQLPSEQQAAGYGLPQGEVLGVGHVCLFVNKFLGHLVGRSVDPKLHNAWNSSTLIVLRTEHVPSATRTASF